MNQQSNLLAQSLVSTQPAQAGGAKKRQPAPVLLGRLKAERVEEPLAAVKVLEALAGIPGWGLSPKAIRLSRVFHFPSDVEAQAFVDFVLHMKRGLKVRPRVVIDDTRVTVTLHGLRGGIPSYLLDFAALLSQ